MRLIQVGLVCGAENHLRRSMTQFFVDFELRQARFSGLLARPVFHGAVELRKVFIAINIESLYISKSSYAPDLEPDCSRPPSSDSDTPGHNA